MLLRVNEAGKGWRNYEGSWNEMPEVNEIQGKNCITFQRKASHCNKHKRKGNKIRKDSNRILWNLLIALQSLVDAKSDFKVRNLRMNNKVNKETFRQMEEAEASGLLTFKGSQRYFLQNICRSKKLSNLWHFFSEKRLR